MSQEPPRFNPYASPVAPPEYVPTESAGPFDGIWRDGKQLLTHRQAILPDICVKTNLPAEGGRLPRNLSWHSPWFALLILFNLLIYLVVALIVTKRAKIEIGISQAARRRRRKGILIGLGIALLGVAIPFVVGVAFGTDGPFAASLAVGMLIFIVGLIVAAKFAAVVSAAKITDTHIWLNGVHPDYLARLPIFAG
ncbi:MAG: hypothetical protein AB7O62_05615 [Pirellulales bacterium]